MNGSSDSLLERLRQRSQSPKRIDIASQREPVFRDRAIALEEILSVGIAQQSSQHDAIHRLWAVLRIFSCMPVGL